MDLGNLLKFTVETLKSLHNEVSEAGITGGWIASATNKNIFLIMEGGHLMVVPRLVPHVGEENNNIAPSSTNLIPNLSDHSPSGSYTPESWNGSPSSEDDENITTITATHETAFTTTSKVPRFVRILQTYNNPGLKEVGQVGDRSQRSYRKKFS